VAGWRRHSLTITPPEELPVPLDAVDSSLTPRRFVLRVVLAARRYTVPGAALLVCWQLAESMVPVIVGWRWTARSAPGTRVSCCSGCWCWQ